MRIHVSARALIGAVALLAITALSAPTVAVAAVPDRIPLPDGSQPEGLSITRRGLFYTGSLADGTIYVGTLATHRVRVLAKGEPGRSAVGVEARGRFLWVAGGETGKAWVFRRSGALVSTYRFEPGGFVNDVVVTRRAAYFTDSAEPYLYRVPIRADGRPAGRGKVEARPLTGDLQYESGFNANGIDRVRGTSLFVVVQSNTGELFTVLPSGHTREIDLAGKKVASGDGVLVIGRVVFVVQNFLNKVAEVRLSGNLASGQVVSRRGDPDFDVPTSIDVFQENLYLVNARFTTQPDPDTPYWIAPIGKS